MDEQEPSVLDYLKSLLMPWKGPRIRLPEPETPPGEELPAESEGLVWSEGQLDRQTVGTDPVDAARVEPPGDILTNVSERPVVQVQTARSRQPYRWPWLSILALLLALFAQSGFEMIDHRSASLGIVLYGLSAVALIGAILRKEWQIPDLPEDEPGPMPTSFHGLILIVGGIFTIVAFFAFSNNRFNAANLLLGLLALGYVILGVYYASHKYSFGIFWQSVSQPVMRFFRSRPSHTWGIILVVVFLTGLALFFRYFRLDSVPGEMFSDHAEKLLDVSDVLNGKTSIFFPRNTGREAIQFYLTAAIASWFGMGLSYISLKLGTATIGFLTLPYIYLLGKEIGGKRVGLFAVGLAAMAYWPNVIARVGLRFPLYPLFAAPALYYFIRGLRRQNRNDFIWSGVAVGIGLHGYTPFRIIPFILIILILLYLLHRQANGKRGQTLAAFMITGLISLVIFLPLLRYALESPMNMDNVGFRTLSRIGTTEQTYPGPPVQIFFENLVKSWLMPFWDDGETWVSSITHRPALDVVTAVLYFLGTIMVLLRYIRKRHWIDLFLLALVPLLMMPSILSLAFPVENPSLTRSGGAIIPVFILAGIGLEGLLKAIQGYNSSRFGLAMAIVVGGGLFAGSVSQNYDLVFNQYENQYMMAAWNTTQVGAVIKDFAATIGARDTAFVIPYPYWVDTRLVGINAGFPTKDYAIPRDQLITTMNVPGPKLFIYKIEDVQTADELQNLYPSGYAQLITGDYQGKDFYVFYVLSQ